MNELSEMRITKEELRGIIEGLAYAFIETQDETYFDIMCKIQACYDKTVHTLN